MRPDPSTDALIGTVIGGRYQIVRRVGKGGMGMVYEADHLSLGKRVAVKLLLDKYTDDEEVVARFQREARTASAIGDDHIVEVTDAGTTDDGRSYLVMELLLGDSLAAIAEATGPMPASRAVPIVRQVLRGLGAAHAKGIVHRDMKPENVFLIQKPDRPDFVKIMDFGISKFMALTDSKVRLTATGAVIGTPVYMAPEQAMGTGEIDARVDLYALGVMLYELLAGRPPFEAPTYIALVTQHLNSPPPPLAAVRPDLPPSLVAAVHRALEKDPAHRFASAAEMAAALPSDAELAGMDRVVTLTGGGSAAWRDPARTAAESPRSGRAARAAPTPGGAAVPTTSRRDGFGLHTPPSGPHGTGSGPHGTGSGPHAPVSGPYAQVSGEHPVSSGRPGRTWPPSASGKAGAWVADAGGAGDTPAPGWPTAAEQPASWPNARPGAPARGATRPPVSSSGARPLLPLGPVETTMRTNGGRRWPLLIALFAGAAVITAIIVVIATRPGHASRPQPAAGSALPPPASGASLEVVSDPAGATITVDGIARGQTPMVIGGLDAGVHEVRLEKEGFAPVVMRKTVRENHNETLTAVMAKSTELTTPPIPPGDRGKPRGVLDKSGRGSGAAVDPKLKPTADGPVTSPDPLVTDPATPVIKLAPPPDKKGPRDPYTGPDPPPNPDRKGNPFGPGS